MGEVGTLYLVGTPIGNLEDITLRAIRILGEVDLIAAEDTRQSIKLLNHLDIHTRMMAYHKHNEHEASVKLRALLREGQNIALISDAGMPLISDPGYQLVADCRQEDIPVTVVPGPNAGLCGVVLSGIDCRRFTFMGFIGKQNKELREGIAAIVEATDPVVLYESPHRLGKFLTQLAEVIPERWMTISREITKRYEETKRGTVAELRDWALEASPKGEFVLVIGGGDGRNASQTEDLSQGTLDAHLTHYLDQGMTEKEAMKQVAVDRGISRREVYAAVKVK
ncbi:16S rRNA (cytidine(1402)-2'-O)-methyltransferase [Eubacterium barkeri]|uniref:Ribosomal RNA small subunit methyltransferase I n=1 Tax=Eubacterium barkeri TaxID=1528 RepID=A0A1H3F360_EUBBA|nr:16S rRNA (cytidine(1402)-2'-O)-methyltransferase [Eubacterium barkeri]SDX85345.1 16S rRNA (cytidine1402-2'-O)-methyltransferase [Eubacterium barkeri]